MHPRNDLLPALFMVSGAGFLVINDALLKVATNSLPTNQIIAIRSVVIVIICAVLMRLLARKWSNPFDPDVVVRTIFTVANVFIFVAAVAFLPFGVAVLVDFTNILYVALLSPLFLAERLTRWKFVSVLIGLAGAATILSPEIRNYGWVIILPLISSLLGAGREIWTRRLGTSHSSEALTLYAALSMILVAIIQGTADWQFGNPSILAIVVIAGVFQTAAMILMTLALQWGEASFVTPFRFTALIWTILLSIFLFEEVLSSTQYLGIALVVSSLVLLTITRRVSSKSSVIS